MFHSHIKIILLFSFFTCGDVFFHDWHPFCIMTTPMYLWLLEHLVSLVQDLWRHEFEWIWLFAPFPYATKYEQFLCISLCAPTSEELRDWAGWVKSRFRYLIPKVLSLHLFCCLITFHIYAAQVFFECFIIRNVEYEYINLSIPLCSAAGSYWHWLWPRFLRGNWSYSHQAQHCIPLGPHLSVKFSHWY